MITPAQLEAMVENLIRIYQSIEDDLLANIAGRLSVLDDVPQDSIAQWQLDKLRQLGALRKENYKAIAARSGKTLKEIETILTNAGYQALEFDERIYQMALSAGLLPAAPVPVNASPGVRRLIQAAIDNTRGYMNLVNTTALEASNKAFIDAVNQVYLEASLGVTDYNMAVRKAVRNLADRGITGATYVTQAGRVIRNHLDVAVKRALVTSARQTTGQLKIQRAREWGSNLVEVSSHIGARPEHAVWQGKIYSIDGGTAEYPNLAASTGYGTVTGLKGANCAHDFWPFFEGLSEQTHFPVDETENARVYEQSQIQRKMEREIREQKRRVVAFEAAGDRESLLAAQLKLKDKEAQLKDFLGRAGRVRLREREQVLGFGRSQASRAVWAKRKAPLPKKFKTDDTVLQATLGDPRIKGILPRGADITNVRVIAGAGTSTVLRAAPSLAKTYGGSALQWQKKVGTISTKNFNYEIHWEEYAGKQYRPKLVRVKAQ